jgi:hypothetical protein
MGNKAKYLIAIILLAVFVAGTVFPVICKMHNGNLIALQETETESSKGAEKISSIELKEYYDGPGLLSCQPPFLLLTTQNKALPAISFRQTFYRSVPTPPPNVV